MLDDIKTKLSALRKVLAARAEKAYTDRDAADGGGEAESYAAGEAHAYGLAEADVREAERTGEEPDRD